MSRAVYVIAGPNGAGKTTFAKEFLPNYADCRNFINADLIAQGISPFSPERVAFRAGRLMLREIASYAARGESFGDSWMIFDNAAEMPRVIAFMKRGTVRIMDEELYRKLLTLYEKP